ncbi:TlpA disulfide reductase family protein [Zoogloea sp.]|uniref:peroxiredoxin family protein n=1 Tax=Zoogloea sp. TaxID=49181 RepID=UPI0026342B06|nr:TlpA disulfide reductase family protein [Zoogloea sp.]MDD3352430.1 TlpA disulfide reductase family protein [Zoogloea sp.]
MSLKAITRFGVAVLLLAFLSACSKPAAPDVGYTTLDGRTVQLSSLRGKVVLVNFWATTCTTCVAEMPKLAETHLKFAPKGFETVAIAMDYDPPEYVRNFAARKGLPFTIALDVTGQAAKGFEDVRLTPTTFLLDKQGRIVQKYLGEPDFTKLHALLEKLLAEPA